MDDKIKQAIKAAQDRAELDKSEKELKAEIDKHGEEYLRQTKLIYRCRNVAINSVIFAWQWIKNQAMFRAVQLKIIYFARYYKLKRWFYMKKTAVQMFIVGYRHIHPDKFLLEFPPKKGHKNCNGKGWVVVQLPNKTKAIRFCLCVTDKYKASGKKYLVDQPGDK